MKKHFLMAVLLVGSTLAHAQGTPALTDKKEQEVAYLFQQLETSGCQFQRNGSWYDAQTASAHLRDKYAYLQKRGWAATAELFIERAASESSITGRAYQVKCGNAAPVASGQWLKEKLQTYRAQKVAKPAGKASASASAANQAQ